MRVYTVTTALALPILITATRHDHGATHHHNHEVGRRSLTQKVVTITEVVTVTVMPLSTTGPSATPPIEQKMTSESTSSFYAPSALSSSAAPSPPSTSDGATKSGQNPFKTLVSVEGSAIIRNSCGYPVFVESVGHESCGPSGASQVINPSTTYTEKLRTCSQGGISLKITKSKDMPKPMQFEYTVWPNGQTVSYDISYLDCMKVTNGKKDLDDCAGHDGGIQALGGTSNDSVCPDYFCLANELCDKQAYVEAEFGYQDGAPVGACGVAKGIAFELCAGNRQM
ncbi:hypothetical protein ACN47E_009554 [Coniothyrium glycines]